MTRVKVCGLTREGDVRLAVTLGAWACGFVLTESPRRLSPERARELVAAATGALAVGVVTTEPAEWVATAVAAAGCDALQLSAGADGPSVAAVRAAAMRRGLRLPVIAPPDTPDVADADLVLLDVRSPRRYGGTGRTLDWTAVAVSLESGASGSESDHPAITAGAAEPSRLVLAGGLAPHNVAEAVTTLRPFAVDVASGIESRPGLKDESLMTRFFTAVAAADAAAGGAAVRRASSAGDLSPEVAP